MYSFVEFVRDKLVPVLGNFQKGEAHSVVIMDNCSIHLDSRVRELIEGAGAIILYSAPYCPDLIPIEYMFNQWKSYLKRFSMEFNCNWYDVHTAALVSVTSEEGLRYFKKTTLVHLVPNDEEEFIISAVCAKLL